MMMKMMIPSSGSCHGVSCHCEPEAIGMCLPVLRHNAVLEVNTSFLGVQEAPGDLGGSGSCKVRNHTGQVGGALNSQAWCEGEDRQASLAAE